MISSAGRRAVAWIGTVCALALMTGCCRACPPVEFSGHRDGDATSASLTLNVFNESPARQTVNVRVLIDGRPVLQRTVHPVGVVVSPQGVVSVVPDPVPLVLELGQGVHRIEVLVAETGARASREIRIGAEPLWCVVLYDYSPGGKVGIPIPEEIEIRVSHEPFRSV